MKEKGEGKGKRGKSRQRPTPPCSDECQLDKGTGYRRTARRCGSCGQGGCGTDAGGRNVDDWMMVRGAGGRGVPAAELGAVLLRSRMLARVGFRRFLFVAARSLPSWMRCRCPSDDSPAACGSARKSRSINPAVVCDRARGGPGDGSSSLLSPRSSCVGSWCGSRRVGVPPRGGSRKARPGTERRGGKAAGAPVAAADVGCCSGEPASVVELPREPSSSRVGGRARGGDRGVAVCGSGLSFCGLRLGGGAPGLWIRPASCDGGPYGAWVARCGRI